MIKYDSNNKNVTDFHTNRNKGFAMAMNGYRISVQWGSGNYVDRDVRYAKHGSEMEHEIWKSNTAEVLIWDEMGRFSELGAGGCLFDLVWRSDMEPLTEEEMEGMEQDEIDSYNARIPVLQAQLDAQGGYNDQVFGHCSSECVAKMISTLVNCGDEDPRPAIAQIYNASFNNKG